MATINYQWLESKLIENKIDLFKFDAYLRQQVWKRLEETQPSLLAIIVASGTTSKELNSALLEITAILSVAYIDIAKAINPDLQDLVYTQAKIQTSIYNEFLGYKALKNPTKDQIGKLIVAGATVEQWWSKQKADSIFAFGQLLRTTESSTKSQIKDSVKQSLKQAYTRSDTLLRTAVAQASTAAHNNVVSKNSGLVKCYHFLATLDSHTSQICRGHDDAEWTLEHKPYGGNSLPFAEPPLHPNCRSIMTIRFKEGVFDLDIEKKRWTEDGDVSRDTTYDDFLKTKTEAEQDVILGKGKARLYREKKITMRDMLDQSGNPMTLQQLEEKYGVKD